jgi:hypothetical protein
MVKNPVKDQLSSAVGLSSFPENRKTELQHKNEADRLSVMTLPLTKQGIQFLTIQAADPGSSRLEALTEQHVAQSFQSHHQRQISQSIFFSIMHNTQVCKRAGRAWESLASPRSSCAASQRQLGQDLLSSHPPTGHGCLPWQRPIDGPAQLARKSGSLSTEVTPSRGPLLAPLLAAAAGTSTMRAAVGTGVSLGRKEQNWNKATAKRGLQDHPEELQQGQSIAETANLRSLQGSTWFRGFAWLETQAEKGRSLLVEQGSDGKRPSGQSGRVQTTANDRSIEDSLIVAGKCLVQRRLMA